MHMYPSGSVYTTSTVGLLSLLMSLLLVLRSTKALSVGSSSSSRNRLLGSARSSRGFSSRNFGHVDHARTTTTTTTTTTCQQYHLRNVEKQQLLPSKRLSYHFTPSTSTTTRLFSSSTDTDHELPTPFSPPPPGDNDNDDDAYIQNNFDNDPSLQQQYQHKQQNYHTTTSILLDGLNDAQIEAVTKPTHSISRVLAGPGSGKTRVLICRIAYLLEQDRLGRVLAVTFTRKAAGEMQTRVEKLLKQQQELRKENEEYDDGSSSNSNNNRFVTEYTGNDDDDNDDDDNANVVVIQQEIDTDIPKGLDRVTLGTFHSICAKILRYNGNLLATLPSVEHDFGRSSNFNATSTINSLDGSFAILDQSDQLRIVRECLDDIGFDTKKNPIKPLTILTAIGQIKEALSQGVDPFVTSVSGSSRDNKVSPAMKTAKSLYYIYREKLFSNNAVDFDDLIYMTRELLIQNRDLRERLHRRWPHLLVDEFQDTSKSQMDLVSLLTSSSLFVVGDADQSIYSWRGAHAGSMDDFQTLYREKGFDVDTVYLKENYRSTSNIVRAAEKVISSSEMSSSSPLAPRKSMKPKRGSGPSPRVVACADERAEANFVVDSILDMLDAQTLSPGEHTVAIIYRTNAQSRHLEEACVQKNLPYVIRGGAGGFYKRAEVKDCLCFLRWIHNGNDEGAMLRAVKTPSRGIGEIAMRQFKEYCDEVNLFHRENYPGLMKTLNPLDVLISMTEGEHPGCLRLLQDGAPTADVFIAKRALNSFIPFSRKMRVLREMAHHEPVDKLLFSIIEDFDLASHFDSISKSKAEFEERRENVQELRQATKRYAKGGAALAVQPAKNSEESFENETPLGNFLDDVALVTDIAGETTDDSRLIANLMTIHASKGMEFDAVFVVGNEEGTLPSGLAIQEGENSIELAEEKRLCYVAMTRAKTQLCMTWRKEVTNYASWSDSGPRSAQKDRSRFLNALVAKKSNGGGKGVAAPKRRKAAREDPMLKLKHNFNAEREIIERRRAPAGTSKQRARPSSRDYSTRPAIQRNKDDRSRHPSGDYNARPAPERRNGGISRPKASAMKTNGTAYNRGAEKRSSGSRINGIGAASPSSLGPPTQIRPRGAPQRPANGASFQQKNTHPKERKTNISQVGRPNNSNGLRTPESVNRPSREGVGHKPVQKQDSSVTPQVSNQLSSPGSRDLMARLSREVVVSKPGQKRAKSVPPPPTRQRQVEQRGAPRAAAPAPPKATRQPAKPDRGGFDSTWFFPVGSGVLHKSFGKGQVLEPPSSGPDKEMLVRVKFQNSGKTMEFHAQEDNIVPY